MVYRTQNEIVWEDQMTDEQRRAVLDQFIMTGDIPSNVKWDQLDYGTKSAIVFTKTVPGIS